MSQLQPRRLSVHGGDGALRTVSSEALVSDLRDRTEHRSASASEVGVMAVMQSDLVCATSDIELDTVLHLLTTRSIGCVPIVDARMHPIGALTKLDLVYWLASPSNQRGRTAADVMLPMMVQLPESATIAQAATLMNIEERHHVLVVDRQHRLTGLVSTRDIVNWLITSPDRPARVTRDPEIDAGSSDEWLPYGASAADR